MNELSKQPLSQPVLENWLKSLAPKTRTSYGDCMKEFAKFAGDDSPIESLGRFLALQQGEAFQVGQQYKIWLKERHAPSSVNQRLSALRSFVKHAFHSQLVPWQLSVKSERAQTYKDTRGPGEDGFEKMLAYARGIQNRNKSLRDVAILKLLYGQAFRREALEMLNLEDFEENDAGFGFVWIKLKGFRERVRFSLSRDVLEAQKNWLYVRGTHDGPFFNPVNQSGTISRERLSGIGIWDVVKKIGVKVGLKTWPHALRHAGTTTALDRMDGDVRAVQRFTGHKDLKTLMIYDDSRRDFGREVAERVSKKDSQ